MTKRFRTCMAVAVPFLLLAATPVAFADDVTSSSSPEFEFSTPTKVLNLDVGQTRTVTFQLVGTGGDAKPGCNLTGNPKMLTLGVTKTAVPSTTLAGLTTPTSIGIPDCAPTTVTASITANTAGSAHLSFPVTAVSTSHANVDASDFDTSAASFRVNVAAPDSTPPVISHVLTPSQPVSGWYAGPVAIDWTVTDAQSAITSQTGCQDETWSTQTSAAGHTFSCTATSAGGTAGPVTVNVKLDLTAPVVTPTVTGTVGDNGWYTSDATVQWATSDALSGLAPGASCEDVLVDTDQPSTTYTCNVLDLAGNSTTSTVTVKRDASAPVITRTVSGTTGDDGWYTSDVAVDWTVVEGTSTPVTLTGCVDETVMDTAGATSSCSATNAAGLTASDSVSVKVDTVAPVVHGAASGTTGDNGWFVGDVVVDWTYDEDGSGVATPCAQGSRTTDTAGTAFNCQVTDRAGNSAALETVTVKRDATAPSITSSVDGTLGANDWYTSDVDVDFEVSDAMSGLSTTAGCDPATLTVDSAGTAYRCEARDLAGNEASDEVVVKRDATAPVITKAVTGTEGLAGWFTSEVDVDWTVAEDVSGPAALVGCTDTTVADTTGRTLTCSATNAAGLEASDSVTLKVDTVAPVVSGTASGTSGDAGWFRGDVTIVWSYTETGSGVTDPCPTATQADDTTGVTFTCTVHDAAGHTSNTGSVTVKRDATPPSLTWLTGPEDGAAYDFGDPVPGATCSATDATSGVTPAGCTVTGGGSSVGPHTLTAAAADNAGNTATDQRTYTVRAWTLEGFHRPVDRAGVLNTVKAGSTVPLKFNVLKGDTRLTSDIGAVFTARKIHCDSGAEDALEEFATTGRTELRYDAADGQWVQNWATPTSGKGSCYRVTVTTADGSSTSASFKLK